MRHSPSTFTGEPGPCVGCGEPCYPLATDGFRHGTLCGFLMERAKEPCARNVGHGGEAGGHTTLYAIKNAARKRHAA